MTTQSAEPDVSDREIVSSRVFDAPRELVFRAFSEPEHLAVWWGPNGFTNTIDVFDFRVDGEWRSHDAWSGRRRLSQRERVSRSRAARASRLFPSPADARIPDDDGSSPSRVDKPG